MRIQFDKLLKEVIKYDKEADKDILWEVWSTVSEEHQQFIIDALDVIENKSQWSVGEVANAYHNINQYAKMAKSFRAQNQFKAVLQDENSVISVDRKGNLVVS
jgi:hypothetical protein